MFEVLSVVLPYINGVEMISVAIQDKAGKEVGKYEFESTELANGINRQLLHDVVVMYEANKRIGSSKTKSRGMVVGSTKKLYRQKGTGRARAGASRTPVRRGGGHTFAKTPKDWSYRLPKKAVKLATRMAILSKFEDEQVTLIDELALQAPKTKEVAGVLKALGLSSTSCLLTVEGHDPVVWKSARNIAGVQVSPASDLNAYDVLHQRQMVLTKSALDRLLGRVEE
ncbi:50S ribosomal protein L4 [Gimesia maris]|uniref:Large ribosomal subunit protein uL4 n=2 Tax=Gimesia maris TaxID=122 RepID=A0ABX5YVV2_9PLAN|nr:50S ribosomal protein L4 [Gimesia maris]QDU17662.1 50S ribosomal protein L4 [Gimesia maris]QEG19688.1 50S ribosomal protein L4 [Gimesia maris]